MNPADYVDVESLKGIASAAKQFSWEAIWFVGGLGVGIYGGIRRNHDHYRSGLTDTQQEVVQEKFLDKLDTRVTIGCSAPIGVIKIGYALESNYGLVRAGTQTASYALGIHTGLKLTRKRHPKAKKEDTKQPQADSETYWRALLNPTATA